MSTWTDLQDTAKRIGFDSYEDYLQSDHWRDLRRLKGVHLCASCKATSSLVCHHIHYRNLLDVTVQDLAVLCNNCHDDFHMACRVFKVDYIGIGEEQIIDAVADFRKTAWYAKRKAKLERRYALRAARRKTVPKGFNSKSYTKFLVQRFKKVARKPTRANAEAFCKWLLEQIKP